MNEAEMKLTWIGKAKRRGGNDVSINVTNDPQTNNCKYVGFSFRNECYKKIVGDGSYFEVAFYKNRMFFKKSDERNGLLLQANRETPNRYAKIQNETAKHFAHWEGDYKLQKDDFWDLYYIERNDKE